VAKPRIWKRPLRAAQDPERIHQRLIHEIRAAFSRRNLASCRFGSGRHGGDPAGSLVRTVNGGEDRSRSSPASGLARFPPDSRLATGPDRYRSMSAIPMRWRSHHRKRTARETKKKNLMRWRKAAGLSRAGQGVQRSQEELPRSSQEPQPRCQHDAVTEIAASAGLYRMGRVVRRHARGVIGVRILGADQTHRRGG